MAQPASDGPLIEVVSRQLAQLRDAYADQSRIREAAEREEARLSALIEFCSEMLDRLRAAANSERGEPVPKANVRSEVREYLRRHRRFRSSDLVGHIQARYPDAKKATIHAQLSRFGKTGDARLEADGTWTSLTHVQLDADPSLLTSSSNERCPAENGNCVPGTKPWDRS